MKVDYKKVIIGTVVVGFIALFFFPEPETNFKYYLSTAMFFIVMMIILFLLKKQSKTN